MPFQCTDHVLTAALILASRAGGPLQRAQRLLKQAEELAAKERQAAEWAAQAAGLRASGR
jgi:hypothetical protein